MPYKIKIHNTTNTVTTNLRAIFTFALGFEVEEMDGQLGILVYPHIAHGVANIFDPRFRREFENRLPENGFGDLKKAKDFLIWLLESTSNCPDEIVHVLEHKEKAKKNNGQEVQTQQHAGGSTAWMD